MVHISLFETGQAFFEVIDLLQSFPQITHCFLESLDPILEGIHVSRHVFDGLLHPELELRRIVLGFGLETREIEIKKLGLLLLGLQQFEITAHSFQAAL